MIALSARKILSFARSLKRDVSGVSMVEFAIGLPMFLTAGLMGLETANRTLIQMQIAQLATQIADNASRIGEQAVLRDRRIFESDITDIFLGANLQGGPSMELFKNGRVILSSLQVVPGTEDQQYIHWQRCLGLKDHQSSYGVEGDGESNSLSGMGPAGNQVEAFKDDAVMFVEISYDYQPISGMSFGFEGEVRTTASYTVRDDRDLTQIYQADASNPDVVSDCSKYTDISN